MCTHVAQAVVNYRPELTGPRQLLECLDDLGFEGGLWREEVADSSAMHRAEARRWGAGGMHGGEDEDGLM